MKRKGEMSKSAIDRGWPHQVAVRILDGQPVGHIRSDGPFSSLCDRGHEVADGQYCYYIYCFADREQANRFRGIVAGEVFDPRDRSGGRWLRGRGAARDAKHR